MMMMMMLFMFAIMFYHCFPFGQLTQHAMLKQLHGRGLCDDDHENGQTKHVANLMEGQELNRIKVTLFIIIA